MPIRALEALFAASLRCVAWAAGVALDLIAPRRCAGCDRPRGPADRVGAFCGRCAGRLLAAEAGPYWAAVQFAGPVRRAVHRLKFEARSDVGRALGAELASRLSLSTVDLVTCVPLSSHRLAERGFNQAALLARAVARRVGRPLDVSAVARMRQTERQSSLGRDARALNVASAFVADATRVRGLHVVVVDDVVTTGQTLDAVRRALVAAGAREVTCIAFARAGRATPQGRSSRA